MITLIGEVTSMANVGSTGDAEALQDGPLKRLVAYIKSKAILENIEYEAESLLKKVQNLAENLFNPILDYLTEDLISLKDLEEIIKLENIDLALMGKKIKFNASECFNRYNNFQMINPS